MARTRMTLHDRRRKRIHGYGHGVVCLRIRGSCSGRPRSTATLKAGFETMLRHDIPDMIEVRSV